jgi:hypothetical protein
MIDPEELSIRQKLKDDFAHYASRCLHIRTKAGKIKPLTLNKAQLHIHDKLETQRCTTGKVRALILKGRQMGASTYIGGRFYWRTTHSRGTKTFILTHEQKATDNLFEMVERYHEHCPVPVRPQTGAANAKELNFPALDSGYHVGTAGSKAVGRSSTLQMFHGSEVAFWPNASGHFAGVVQAVADEPGTEIILESTANGVGGEFHSRWQQAEAGIGDYQAIFVPWFWDDGYVRDATGFIPTEEEEEYGKLHGLTNEQLAWRRNKIAELGDELLFRQEYPATAAEAFQMSGHDGLIKPEAVVRARKYNAEALGPKVLGVDPARFGDDRFSIALRQTRKVHWIESKSKIDTVAGANWVRQVIDAEKPERTFIDVGGLGAGVVDLLASWGYNRDAGVIPINFGGEPQEPVRLLPDGSKKPGAKNRRAEMWSRSRDWLDDVGGADIPDSDSLQADACGPSYGYDANQRLFLERKEDMRKRGLRSPDEWDAIALTFAEPVAEKRIVKPVVRPIAHGAAAGWMGGA